MLIHTSRSTTLHNRLRDILVLKNGLTAKHNRDLFQVNCDKERRYNLRISDFRLPHYNTVTYGKHSIRFQGPLLWAKLTKKERHIKTLSAFRTIIRKKDISTVLEACG